MVTSIYSSAKFLENPYKKSLLKEAIKAPEKEINDLAAIAREKQYLTTSKIVLFFQKIWHHIKLCFSKSYKDQFHRAAKKIDLYHATLTDPNVKATMLNDISTKVAPRMQQAWAALLSDCDKYINSWNCGSDGTYTLELSQALNLLIPASQATLQFATVVTGNLDKSSQQMNFASGFSTQVPGVAGTPTIFWMSYNDNGDIISVRGGYHNYWPFAQTKDNPAETIISDWQNHKIQ